MKKYDLVFFVSNLNIHGGTTFVKRFSKHANGHGKKILVFCLVNYVDETILSELSKYADVVFLREYLATPFNKFNTNQLSIFLPINKKSIQNLVSGCHVHVMGVFGLYFLLRLFKLVKGLSFSIGLYHQNEFDLKNKKYFFSKYIINVLRKISHKQLIFFNECSRNSFCTKYDLNKTLGLVTPIGIDLVDRAPKERSSDQFKLISVGNLVGFKTYNQVVISLLPTLLIKYPKIRYDIIGDGPYFDTLVSLCNELNLQEVITFHGVLDYDTAFELVERSDVFIGSGTAILEASIRYIPSIIGIECEFEPITYGFISDIKGFDYNEKNSNVETVKISECIDKALSSKSAWYKLSQSCHAKALTFGISNTFVDFMKVSEVCKNDLVPLPVSSYPNNIRCFFSFLYMCILDYLNFDRSFRLRRDIDE